ncbi:MAG: leucyl aminopeptidase family protein [Desulfurococcales archaeon]|nr:leucyl aminopeptidase family protein [Desulfurococcales archaeon]
MVLFTNPPVIAKKTLEEYTGKVIVVPIMQKDEKPVITETVESLDKKHGLELEKLIETGLLTGKKGETIDVYRGGKRFIVAGLGGKDLEDASRRVFAKIIKQLVEKEKEVYLVLNDLENDSAREAVIGALLGAYKLEHFKKEKKRKLEAIFVDKDLPISEITAIVEGIYLARDVANSPPNELYPEKLSQYVRELFSNIGNVEVEVKTYEQLVEEGFGGIINVGKGSAHKPALIIIRYKGADSKPLALVGKTLVFDAGGINLKPSHSITSMRLDKAGGAAVLGATWIIAKTGLPVNLITLLPAAINVPSGESYLPSDVIKMWDGTRVEITNTDAEGRLVLADAIAYAAKKYDADPIIELSTLTGAIVVALGGLIAGLFTRDEELRKLIEQASKKTGEKVWYMPMVDEYKVYMTKNAKVGDIDNAGMRWGGAIYAALFLEKFTHGKRFVHLDIAGPGIGFEAGPAAPEYWPQGLGPGFGARLIFEAVKALIK